MSKVTLPLPLIDQEREAELTRRIDHWLAHMTWRPDFERWREGRIWQERQQDERLRLIARYGGALKDRRILDLGSGMGGTSVALRLAGAAPLAFEYNRAYCDIFCVSAERYDMGLPVATGVGEYLQFGSLTFGQDTGFTLAEPLPDAAGP